MYKGIQGYTRVYKGIQGYTRVYKGIQGYTRVYKGIQGYTRVYKGIQGYTRVYKGIQGYTRVYKGIQGYTRVYKGIQGYTRVYKGIQECWGKFLFPFVFRFLTYLLSCILFFRSGILFITLPLSCAVCKFRYNLLPRPYFIASFFFLYGAISVTTFVEVSSLFGGPDHQPCLPQHLVSSFVFIAFSFISFCSRLKVVFLYCNYYFFALCRNLLSLWFENSKTFADRERVVFWNWPLPVHFCMELALARSKSIQGYTRVYKGIQGYTRVYKGIQGYTRVYKGIQGYTGVCKGIKGYTRVYKDIQGCTRVYKGIQGYTRVCKSIQGYTRVDKGI